MQLLSGVGDLPRTSNVRTQVVALWITAISLVGLVVAAIAFPGFWPPTSPQTSAADVATFYRDNTSWIRLSVVTFNFFSVMFLPLFCVLVVQMKRMTTQSQVFAYCHLSATVSGATIFALATVFFGAAAYRPNRDSDLIMVLNDLGWIVLIAPVGMMLAQNLMLALAVYHDKVAQPVFPRWVGHFSVLVMVAMAPAALSVVVDSGPLAWNGLVSFWLRNIAFVAYVVVMLVMCGRAVRRQAIDEGLVEEPVR
ncbi:hypothetical protein ACQ86B_05725 [Mycolicibacterium aichiense]|uniref:hypothetical protein n=1 Tax=Mycolicibacterium aichiense TaxID=1799 RepID=UPI003D67362F